MKNRYYGRNLFDPIHSGHLMLGKQAYEEYDLDCVWYMPSRQPPTKRIVTLHLRLTAWRWFAWLLKSTPFFACSDFELCRTEGNTYTADTLLLLKQAYPDTEFYFIVGADSIFDIEKWYHPEIVMKNAVILAADRACGHDDVPFNRQIEYLTKKYDARICRLHSRRMDVSSQLLRQKIQNGEQVSGYIPDPVLQFIRERRLYSPITD